MNTRIVPSGKWVVPAFHDEMPPLIGTIALDAISMTKYRRMPMAKALRMATVCGDTLRARAIGKPKKIVKPAIAPSSAVSPKLKPRGAVAVFIGFIVSYIAANRLGVPA
jgi:hypothetical protein